MSIMLDEPIMILLPQQWNVTQRISNTRELISHLFNSKRIYLPPLEAEHFQQKLDETTVLLRELQKVQKERLSAKQPPNIICLLVPTAKELQLGMHKHNI